MPFSHIEHERRTHKEKGTLAFVGEMGGRGRNGNGNKRYGMWRHQAHAYNAFNIHGVIGIQSVSRTRAFPSAFGH